MQGLAGGAAEIAPILLIDGKTNSGKPIQFDDAKSSGGGSGALGGFGGFGGALGGGGGASGQTQFVAEYLEFELSIPGSEKQILRRTLIDRGGAAWRLASPLDPKTLQKLASDTHGPIAAQVVHNICISSGPHDLAGVARAIQSFIVEDQTPAPADAPAAQAPAASESAAQLWLLGLRDLVCQIPTDHWFLPALNDDPSARLYPDSPRICIFSIGVQSDGTNQIVESQIDWRRDRIRGVAREASASAEVAKRKIWYGLLEGALEHELGAQTADPSEAAATIQSTSAALNKSGAVAIRPSAQDAGAQSPAHNPETAARIAGALKAGDVLVVPRTVLAGDGPPAWWAISLADADTRAVWGTDMNAMRGTSPLPKPGNSGAGVWELQEDGRIIRVKDPAYRRKGAGNEYGTITIEISIDNIFAVSVISWGLHEVYRLLVVVFSN